MTIYLAFAVSKYTNIGSSLCSWMNDRGAFRETFARQAIPMMWDFAEANPLSKSGGSLKTIIDKGAQALLFVPANDEGYVIQADASSRAIDQGTIVSTDPPYYDNIGYADLSDYFYVWLRRALRSLSLSFFNTMLVPKEEELIAAQYRHGGKKASEEFFLNGMTRMAYKLAEASDDLIPTTIYYAFKQSETKEGVTSSVGWATFLAGIIKAGFSVQSTWPVRTEGSGRLIAKGTNALASSIVLVCRKRSKNASIATRKEFIQALSEELPIVLNILQNGNIAPVDLPQSSIGPGISIYSRYSRIYEADGSSMSVTTALQLINDVIDQHFSAQEAAMDSWTRFAVTWFSQNKFDEGSYGDAETLATARVVTVDGVQEAGILQSGGGKVCLLKRDELDPNWDPATDTRLTVWEVTHYLIRELLDGGGEMAAAKLLKKVGGLAEDAKGLAYRLYTICEQNKWAELGRDYNMLVTLWPELVKQAQELESEQSTQSELEI